VVDNKEKDMKREGTYKRSINKKLWDRNKGKHKNMNSKH
jgi:hypothetical protein